MKNMQTSYPSMTQEKSVKYVLYSGAAKSFIIYFSHLE